MLCDRLMEIVSQIIFMHIIVILMHKFCLQQYNRNHGNRDPVQSHNYLFIYFFVSRYLQVRWSHQRVGRLDT